MAAKEANTRAVFPQVVRGPDLERRAVLYARVSTNNGQDPEVQLRELREYCLRRGWPVVGEYVEAAAARGLRDVRLVHGRGRGVQRAAVQAALERHPRVVEFWDDPIAHLGATIARLRQDE